MNHKRGALKVKNLSVSFKIAKKYFTAVDEVSFSVQQGECLGIVGESGSGKTVASLAIMGLCDSNGKIEADTLSFQDYDLLTLDENEWRTLRGPEISIVFQDPLAALNPVFTVGQQIKDVLLEHRIATPQNVQELAFAAFTDAGIPDPERTYHAYPYQLSGGLRQRVSIAMAICAHPSLLIADEPTTALDVSVQAQILHLFNRLKTEKQFAMIFVSHALDVVASVADRIMVMYAGKMVEMGSVRQILNSPSHPYTKALIGSMPSLTSHHERLLQTIPGSVPGLDSRPSGCRFHPRCAHRISICSEVPPSMEIDENTGNVFRCYNPLSSVPKPRP